MGEVLPLLGSSLSYIFCIVLFVLILYLPTSAVSELVYPAGGCLFCQDGSLLNSTSLSLLYALCWNFHYARRLYEVFFIHDYRRPRPSIEILSTVYYSIFALWFAWGLRDPPFSYNGCCSIQSASFIIGIVLFSIGEIGNFICHRMLFQLSSKRDHQLKVNGEPGLRDSLSSSHPPEEEVRPMIRDKEVIEKSKHVIPRGFLFEYVSCPHYFFELLTWFGYMVFSWTLATLIFFIVSFIALVDRASKTHKRYHTEFDGQEGREAYPRSRKALIPFLL